MTFLVLEKRIATGRCAYNTHARAPRMEQERIFEQKGYLCHLMFSKRLTIASSAPKRIVYLPGQCARCRRLAHPDQ